MLHVFRFAAVMLTALGLAMGVAHTLELAPRMGYDADLYMRVTSTLYRMYGLVGGALQVGALVAVAVLCWMVRGRRGFRLTVASLVALAVSLGLWAALVQPVNAEWGRVLQSDPSSAPAAYLRLRSRWEYGHVIAAAAWLAGLTCLVLSLLVEIPRRPQPDAGPLEQRPVRRRLGMDSRRRRQHAGEKGQQDDEGRTSLHVD